MGVKHVYLDNGSTSQLDPRVLEAMMPFLSSKYGNASSAHSLGNASREALEQSRSSIAGMLGAQPDEIIFTSGGTESDNLAIKGVAYRHRKGHIITSSIEHPAVLNACRYLETNGFTVTHVPVTSEGLVTPESVEDAITNETILITIMHANNEVGTVQPISKISRIARDAGITFHTDAVQSIGKIRTGVDELGIDLLSLSSHKFHGPKGVGALYMRKGTEIVPLLHGGGHERGIRSGTENVPGIVGLGAAAEFATGEMGENNRVRQMSDKLIEGVLGIEDSRLNGAREPRLPNNANVRFKFIEGEGLILALDAQGIQASTASACSSSSLKPSHVLLAMGLKPEDAHGSLRFTLSKFNTWEDIDWVLEALPEAVESLRSMSPFRSDKEINEFKERYATEAHEHVH